MIRQCPCPSPFGELTLAASSEGLVEIRWPGEPLSVTDEAERAADEPDGPDGVDGDPDTIDRVLDRAVSQLGEYFAGTRQAFDLPLAPSGTPFQLAVWQVLRTIPYGTTWTYGQQAAALGDARKARAVGSANGRNPLPIVVPCHRVCAAGGGLGGFTGGLHLKTWLLDHERHTLRSVRADRSIPGGCRGQS